VSPLTLEQIAAKIAVAEAGLAAATTQKQIAKAAAASDGQISD
jgi:hypothetical protein